MKDSDIAMKIDTEKDHFQEATQYLSAEARWYAIEGLSCMFHNKGYQLAGNTAENDTLWLARSIWSRERFGANPSGFDQASEEDRKRYLEIADIAIKALPALAERIASRYIEVSKALGTMSRIAREQAETLREAKRKQRERRRHE